MSIQRYEMPHAAGLDEYAEGDIVMYDDHVAEVGRLAADLAAARAERDGLADALRLTLQGKPVRNADELLAALPSKED